MKKWLLKTSLVQSLKNYVCYCEEDPVTLLLEDLEYDDYYKELINDLWDSFGYLYGADDISEDLSDEEYDDEYDERFEDFCSRVSLESEEISEDEYENNLILIDNRKC